MRISSHRIALPLLVLVIVLGLCGIASRPSILKAQNVAAQGVKTQQAGPRQQLLPSDSTIHDGFGIVVALDQDTLVVNAKEAAYVFGRAGDEDEWEEIAKLTLPGIPTEELILLASDVQSDTIVIGATWSEEDEFDDHSEVYIFDRNQGGANNWGLVKKLIAAEGSVDDNFGAAVALDGDLLAVGASQIDVDANPGVNIDQGAAYLYGRNVGGSNNWGLVKQITQDDGKFNDEFGLDIDLDGDILVVGATMVDLEGVSGEDHGATYIYGRNVGGAEQWGLMTRVTATDAESMGNFGGRLRLDGDTLAIGAGFDEDTPGSVHIFERNAGGVDQWGAVQRIEPPAGDADLGFGFALDLDGDRLLVGSPLVARCGRVNQGAVYVLDRVQDGPDAWVLVERLGVGVGQDGYFGIGVATDNGTMVIGAPNVADRMTMKAGLAYVNPVSLGDCVLMPFAPK